ncbi:uncharacterized protein SPAPADRAFT_145253 [Spathaspora passalidarum NRRL Y-27907]|uniref:Zn(2)-C6 fungal-type domain-containing protein n=1 Tax=Spathaspora passalidarum (strain NRRL Y-27907 / 11-Y1) TaxID=619300 RepID=G3AEY3_SPAPN|nr:uncharacterized protein SPAPADRAFT_145253 [Spathaspora passalidarum NRRL Y-27907]EGW34787.1 hypothetical protein SPAPADRAFT_145253 [Spathaspora passalidarum NRRL Y-27907]
MFYILDLNNLETIESTTNDNVVIPPVSLSKKVQAKDIVVGSTIRSRNGCLQCRKRKKKCDEKYPTCGSCKHRKVECHWRNGTQFRILKKEHKREAGSKKIEAVEKPDTNYCLDKLLEQCETVVTPFSLHTSEIDPIITEIQSIDNIKSPIDLDNIESPNLDDFLIHNFNLIHQPSLTPLILDNKGSNFLDAFIHKVAKDLCIGPESSNYFLKTFYQLSYTEDSISYLLCAWGGLFIDGYTDDVKSYMGKASELIEKQYNRQDNLSTYDIYVLLNYYLINIGVHICAGDVSNWYNLFKKVIKIIQDHGGLNHICKVFNYSNDIKWLISDIQYHDIMSSITFTQGTKFPMVEYNEIFTNEKILELDDYGLDPFQGCIQPIYLLLGDIITTSVEFNENSPSDSTDEDSRLAHYQLVINKYDELERRLAQCQPNINQMNGIPDEELELHLTLFETYSLTCQLCMNYQIRKIPPVSIEMQSLLLNTLKHIDILIDTKLMTSLAFPLLICGITCSSENDRLKMIQRFQKVSQDYKVANLKRMFNIVKQVWERNMDGKIYIDWNEIVQENNWHLSMC